MDEGSVSAPGKSRPSWKLAPPLDAATQGLVVTGFGGLETGRALFLEIGGDKKGGAWLRALAEKARFVRHAHCAPFPEIITLTVSMTIVKSKMIDKFLM